MDTKKNMSREQLLAYMRDNCTEAEAQQAVSYTHLTLPTT